MTNDATDPVEVTQADRALFCRLFGTLPSDSPIDQRALNDIAQYRIASRATDKTLADKRDDLDAETSILIQSLMDKLGVTEHVVVLDGLVISSTRILTSLEGQG